MVGLHDARRRPTGGLVRQKVEMSVKSCRSTRVDGQDATRVDSSAWWTPFELGGQHGSRRASDVGQNWARTSNDWSRAPGRRGMDSHERMFWSHGSDSNPRGFEHPRSGPCPSTMWREPGHADEERGRLGRTRSALGQANTIARPARPVGTAMVCRPFIRTMRGSCADWLSCPGWAWRA